MHQMKYTDKRRFCLFDLYQQGSGCLSQYCKANFVDILTQMHFNLGLLYVKYAVLHS